MQKSVISIHPVSPRILTQVIRLGGGSLYPVDHPASPYFYYFLSLGFLTQVSFCSLSWPKLIIWSRICSNPTFISQELKNYNSKPPHWPPKLFPSSVSSVAHFSVLEYPSLMLNKPCLLNLRSGWLLPRTLTQCPDDPGFPPHVLTASQAQYLYRRFVEWSCCLCHTARL